MGLVSLFSGIGGIELGLRKHLPDLPLLLLCEINEDARRVLAAHFPGVPVHDDVRTLEALPANTTVVTAGSPCTDLSSVGKKAGIHGPSSCLVDEVFRLVEGCDTVQTIVLENVPNLLRLHGGEGMRHIATHLERLGFAWAYRVLDAHEFGLPQWRSRVVVVATRGSQPPMWLFAHGEESTPVPVDEQSLQRIGYAGFYINEGKRGSGYRVGLAPTIKSNGNGAQTVCGWQPHCLLLSPDARADGVRVVYLHIEDAELAQGLPCGWTLAAGSEARRFARVGNAVPVRFFEFIGAGIAGTLPPPPDLARPTSSKRLGWPDAAYSTPDGPRPVQCTRSPHADWHSHPTTTFTNLDASRPVSGRAALGFLRRAGGSGRSHMPAYALEALREHAARFTERP